MNAETIVFLGVLATLLWLTVRPSSPRTGGSTNEPMPEHPATTRGRRRGDPPLPGKGRAA